MSSQYSEALPLGGGRSVPLPTGQWQVIHSALGDASKKGFSSAEITVLKNLRTDSEVPLIVVRVANASRRWSSTDCMARRNESSFMNSMLGTKASELVNKCTETFALGVFGKWAKTKAEELDKSSWWAPVTPAFQQLETLFDQQMLVTYIEVTQFNGPGVSIQAFVRSPNRLSSVEFRDAWNLRRESASHEILETWLALYAESTQQSFLDKKKAQLPPLAFHQRSESQVSLAASTLSTSSSVEATTSPTPPPPTIPASSVQEPSATIAVGSGASTLEKEREQLVAELSAMRSQLAQLQESNAKVVAAEAQARQQAEALAKLQSDAKARAAEELAAADRKAREQVVLANRKALVIGNDSYTDVPRLINAVSDAQAMAKALESTGFKVALHTNLTEKQFKQTLRNFRQQVEGGDEVVFFYAGHGVQLGNSNYLLPTDIKGDSEDQVRDDAIQLQRLLDDLQDRKAKFSLAVIDACRDNPFPGKGRAIGGRGLAPTTAATGQMVMFSAGSGQQALDKLSDKDAERNGLFTRIFVKEMVKPGVSVDRVLRNVRNEVVRLARTVGHEQTPALYDQAIGEFYFRP